MTAVQACGYVPTPAPVLPAYVCEVCSMPLHAVPTANRQDWAYADDTGATVLDETPEALKADPAQWWADLAERDIATYSAHKARVDLAMFSWWHPHRPAPVRGHDYGPVPQTCGQPMWAGPDGWVCRVHREVFPYEAAG